MISRLVLPQRTKTVNRYEKRTVLGRVEFNVSTARTVRRFDCTTKGKESWPTTDDLPTLHDSDVTRGEFA